MKPRAMNFVMSGSLRPSLLLAAALLALLLVAQPSVAWAQSTSDEEAGCSCHSAETEVWEQSPHALAARDGLPMATCEDCHGPYVRGHPDDGVMALTVDSDVCYTCHSGTFNQWEGSVHAQAGVQCTSCHLSHSQSLRLSDETLCLSCHRDSVGDNFHLSHQLNDVTCTNCHPAPSTSMPVGTASGAATIPAPNHDFVGISGDKCVECHRQYIGQEQVTTTLPASDMEPVKLVAMANRVPELTAKVKSLEMEELALAGTSITALGLGTGVGSVLGIVFVLAVGYVMQQRRSKS